MKIPLPKEGLKAIEDLTYQGVKINATVCFNVPQSLAVVEAVERGWFYFENNTWVGFSIKSKNTTLKITKNRPR